MLRLLKLFDCFDLHGDLSELIQARQISGPLLKAARLMHKRRYLARSILLLTP